MKTTYLLGIAITMMLVGCLHNPDASPKNYLTEGVYCWHRTSDQKWVLNGLMDQCPPNTKPMSDEVVDPAP